ncbi:hypothetical protein BDR05DRAFT_977477 [Suillus weaverae]|nr:hypothetical protein BDR05DRAFT_977477 [Suillus weaverae]
MQDFLWLYTNVVAGDGPSAANPVGGHGPMLQIKQPLYLQSIKKFVCAQDLVEYLSIPEHQVHHGFTKMISQRTARQWMNHLGFHWRKEQNGQYCDGHEWEDVWKHEGEICIKDVEANAALLGCRIVVRFHDKSMFYAHDQQKQRWVHSSEGGRGFFDDYGWLRSPDGEESAYVLFQAGKACDGYFTNDDILAHATKAMDILEKWYSHEDHVLVFDNATTHLKQADDALSAQKMPKGPSATWGVPWTIKDANGNIVFGPDGKPLKEKIPMAEARLPNGNPQSLYFPNGHPKAGFFKGMAQILVECGYVNAPKLHAECKDFKYSTDSGGVCCCHQLMYIQPDFVNVDFDVIFLPKFHCKLNFIEQCWGFMKWLYQMKDRSSSEEVLKCNVIESLDAIPMESMRCFTMRSARFIDAYQKGLNGTQAAWAIKKYCGHHVLLQTILDELDCPALP